LICPQFSQSCVRRSGDGGDLNPKFDLSKQQMRFSNQNYADFSILPAVPSSGVSPFGIVLAQNQKEILF
jgi:hypothetical protein